MSRKRSKTLDDQPADYEEKEVEKRIGEGEEEIEGKGSDERRDAAVTKSNDSNHESSERKSGEEKKTYRPQDWSEEDEIAILQGFLDYKNLTGKNPHEDVNRFYPWVKGSISIDVSMGQIFLKMLRLFQFFDSKRKEPIFAKPHDRKVFDLCVSNFGEGRFESLGSLKITRREHKKRVRRSS